MVGIPKRFALVLAALAVAAQVRAQEIENELVLVTPVAKTLTDPALAEFAKYAKERWNVEVKTSALAAGTYRAPNRPSWKAGLAKGGRSALPAPCASPA